MKSLFSLSGFKNKAIGIHPDILFLPGHSPYITQIFFTKSISRSVIPLPMKLFLGSFPGLIIRVEAIGSYG